MVNEFCNRQIKISLIVVTKNENRDNRILGEKQAPQYRAYAHDVTILPWVFQTNETAAMLV